MKTLKFITNIKCTSCVEKVTPALNSHSGVKQWSVDLNDQDKVLTVEAADDLKASEIEKLIKETGFRAVEKKPGLFSKIFR